MLCCAITFFLEFEDEDLRNQGRNPAKDTVEQKTEVAPISDYVCETMRTTALTASRQLCCEKGIAIVGK